MTETKPIPVTVEDLKKVLNKMQFYQRSTAYMARDANGDIQIYDSEPNDGAALIHRDDIKKAIESYEHRKVQPNTKSVS